MHNKLKQSALLGKVRNVAAGIGFMSVVAITTAAGAITLNPDLREAVFFSEPVQALFAKQIDMLSDGSANAEMTQTNVSSPSESTDVGNGLGRNLVPIKFNAIDPSRPLSAGQRQIAQYLAKRYRVSQDAVESIVKLAYKVGRDEKIDPTLILAIVGVESSYNPFAASSVGAKGLMQVMPKIHKDKFEELSPGDWSALNPEMNMRVGAQIIKEYTRRTGSVKSALRWYVGAAVSGSDGGYPEKVLGLKAILDARFKQGRLVAQSRPSDKVSAAELKSRDS
ncbi:lytic transglycosylase domain-containing protein [Limnobacter sp.]|uniref:lytic transglycosylase domain-containing protein n=1 Tax=Limnobacter sp. TaxID=2003368 RepID=UPI00258D495F|nr:lytic transglycosylase domain-containing protein [Limnobacter sp.]HEX5487061.1 lytic transglycosylase domain-containing protein [Limnobacter sp.]